MVIAVLMILAALLMPALSNDRDSAESAICISNLRQIGMGCQFYLGDNNGRLVPIMAGVYPAPGYITWCGLVAPYLRDEKWMGLFRCPSEANPAKKERAALFAGLQESARA